MKTNLTRLFSIFLAIICMALPIVTAAENTVIPAEGTKITAGDYVYTMSSLEGQHCWEVTGYTGKYLPRRCPDSNIPEELEGFPVQFWNNDIYADLNRQNGIYLYAPVSETECYLTGYTGYERIAYLPSELDGYTVTGIANYAFAYSGFTLDAFANIVVFSDTIRYVGKYAFYLSSVSYYILNDGLECIDNLAFGDIIQDRIALPGSLKEIGENPFGANYYVGRDNQQLILTDMDGIEGWSNDYFAVINGALYSLEDHRLITYLDQMQIDYFGTNIAYWEREYTVAEGTEIIGADAFFATTSLEKVILPEGLTEIKAEAFSCCVNLQEINIPSTVTTIGRDAFSNCKLSTVTIPATVTSIGDNAFDNTVTIICEDGSAAEAYCIRENIPYIDAH